MTFSRGCSFGARMPTKGSGRQCFISSTYGLCHNWQFCQVRCPTTVAKLLPRCCCSSTSLLPQHQRFLPAPQSGGRPLGTALAIQLCPLHFQGQPCARSSLSWFLSPLALLGLWAVVANAGLFSANVLIPPQEVWLSLTESLNTGELQEHLAALARGTCGALTGCELQGWACQWLAAETGGAWEQALRGTMGITGPPGTLC